LEAERISGNGIWQRAANWILRFQEVEKIFPEVVSTDDKGYKTIDYGKLTPALVEAVKEQQKEISDLKKDIDELKKMVQKLSKYSSQ
jgi:hypothetical protein